MDNRHPQQADSHKLTETNGNRAIVISELYGPAEAIKAIENIAQLATLKKYYLLPATLGELYVQIKNHQKANQYFAQAMELTRSAAEKKLLQQKMNG